MLFDSVHGNWAEWSDWGDCTVTCGGGQRRRFRTCTNPAPKHHGRPCIGNSQMTETCNTDRCAGMLWVHTILLLALFNRCSCNHTDILPWIDFHLHHPICCTNLVQLE